MKKILKVYADKKDVAAICKAARVIESYDAFVLAEADEKASRSLGRKFPVEDITNQYDLSFRDRRVATSQPRINAAGSTRPHAAYRDERPLRPGPHHYVVQFIGPIKQNWLTKIRATGAKLREPRGNFAYVVWAREPTLLKVAGMSFVRWLGHLPYKDRISPQVLGKRTGPKLPRRRERPGVYTVEIFAPEDAGRIARASRRLGFEIISQEPRARLLLLKTKEAESATTKQVQKLSEVHGVRFVRQRVVPRLSNNVATTVMGNDYTARAPGGLKLAGQGEIIAVCDTGLDSGEPSAIHPDFAGRIVAIKSYPITPDWNSVITNPGGDDGPSDLDSGHGTHVSGSVLGNGAASAADLVVICGHASKAKIVFQAVEQEMKWRPDAPAKLKKERYVLAGIPANLAPLFQYAYGQGARIHSNSWGGGDPGVYDDQCRQFDQFVWDHKDFCFVIAAGNDGSDEDGDGKINLMSVTSPGTAKNCITVGACENLRPEFNSELYGDWWPTDFPANPVHGEPMADDADQVVAFSSRGPTKDNRIKPDVVAPGTFILSTRSTKLAPNNFAWKAYPPNKSYFFMGGTSMATPLTAGAVGLVREFLRKEQGLANPSAALLKATLLAGAQRLPKTAPAGTIADPHQGFGRVNLDRSLKRPLGTIDGPVLKTGQKSTTIVSIPTGGKNLRIAMCYSDFPGENLVNNLNLIVSDPSGKRYVGNQKTVAGSSLKLDAKNNVEIVEVQNAKPGKWTIDVVAGNVPVGPQDFAVAAVAV
jgi:subtilisin family serine protease